MKIGKSAFELINVTNVEIEPPKEKTAVIRAV
jgi:hypothetical protein